LGWPSGATVVHGDRLRLAQALDNLIANAIEHGGGAVEVCGRMDTGYVRVEVTDDGPGLPAPVAELSRRARRGRESRGRGLAIASTVAHEHGGRLASAPTDRGPRPLLGRPLPRPRGRRSRARGRAVATTKLQVPAQPLVLHDTVQLRSAHARATAPSAFSRKHGLFALSDARGAPLWGSG